MENNSNGENKQIEELKNAFSMFDKDGSGTISRNEMEMVFTSLKIDIKKQEIQDVIDNMDVDGDGEISFEEFIKNIGGMGGNLFDERYTNEEIEWVFNFFDENNKGYITIEELSKAFTKFGYSYTTLQLKRMIKKIDKNSDGKISLDEFTQLMDPQLAD